MVNLSITHNVFSNIALSYSTCIFKLNCESHLALPLEWQKNKNTSSFALPTFSFPAAASSSALWTLTPKAMAGDFLDCWLTPATSFAIFLKDYWLCLMGDFEH